jgi:DNA-directed RNA polymerase specialized sigma24 family protein
MTPDDEHQTGARCVEICDPTIGSLGCRGESECRLASDLMAVQPSKIRWLLGRGLDRATAEDVVSAAMLKLWRVTVPIENLSAYFHQIVRREHLDLIRRLEVQKRFSHLLATDDADHTPPWAHVEYREMIRVLSMLKGVSRMALDLAELRWVWGWSTQDLMTATGMSKDAIDQAISRLRKAAVQAREDGVL